MAASETVRPREGDALILVDMQNDFVSGGALPVPDGDAVVPILNRYIKRFHAHDLPVIATRDWHPPNHCSFREQGGPWPPHCVQGTRGAEFVPELDLPEDTTIISAADTPEHEAYSGFEGTDMADRLHQMGVKRLFVGGLATDYCVVNTVLDGLRQGFEVMLLEDAIRAIDVNPGDGDRAIREMQANGAQTITWEMLAE
mgnify:CR=1 FL=1